MNDKKFEEFVDGIRQQLEDKGMDYVLIVADHQDQKAVEGIVNIHTDHGIHVPADMLFSAALDGEKAPQRFIERIIENVIKSVQGHLHDKMEQFLDKDKSKYN